MKKLMTIALVSLMTVSCSKEFIDLKPISTVSIDVLYKTDKDFVDALRDCSLNCVKTKGE